MASKDWQVFCNPSFHSALEWAVAQAEPLPMPLNDGIVHRDHFEFVLTGLQ